MMAHDLTPCDADFVARLTADLPDGVLRPVSAPYLSEPRGRWHGVAGALALPRDVEEVAALLRACHAARVPVVPYGGGTGLVGGQLAPDGPAPLFAVAGTDDLDPRCLPVRECPDCRGRRNFVGRARGGRGRGAAVSIVIGFGRVGADRGACWPRMRAA